MKKQFLFGCAAMLALAGCNDKLDTENLYQKNLENYYSNPTEINEALSGVYNSLYNRDVFSECSVTANLMSDLMLGGGGPDDQRTRNLDAFQDPTEDTYRDLWINTYNGMYRANAILEVVAETDYSDYFTQAEDAASFKAQTLGETYFMRSYLLYRGATYFGGMPLIIATDTPRDIARATIDETYAQILSDMYQAIQAFPNKPAASYTLQEYGHANKWIAEGMLARMFMYYTGYKTNIMKEATSDVTLTDGTVLTKQMVIDYLQDCIDNSGYALVSDFRNLWPYSHINKAYQTVNGTTDVILPWADDLGLEWAGQDGIHSELGTGNPEVMFAKRFAFGNWAWWNAQAMTNRMCLHLGIRSNSMVPFGQGWGWGTVNSNFFNQWDDNDPRKLGSILELKEDPSNGISGYVPNKGMQETKLVNKKFLSYQFEGPDGKKGMFAYLYNMTSSSMQLWHAQDFPLLRFADVLLMQSELTEDASYMNLVRARSGLDAVSYSLQAVKEERMHEFAFEGLRWFDLVRWGDVETSNNFWSQALEVSNTGVIANYEVQYRPETKGLVSVPESEIRLSNGVYTQNPGWE